MADGTRLRYDGVETYLATQLNQGVTTIEFSEPLKQDGDNAFIDTLVGDEYLALTILDANYRLREIVHLIAYDAGAVTGTIERAQEGTSDVTHPVDSKVVHSATVMDFMLVQDHDSDPNAHDALLTEAKAYTDTEIAGHDAAEDSHALLVRRTGDSLDGDFVLSAVDGDGDPNIFTIEGTLQIGADAELVVEGDLVVNGRLFLNGREVRADNNPPPAPTPNVIWIQTYG